MQCGQGRKVVLWTLLVSDNLGPTCNVTKLIFPNLRCTNSICHQYSPTHPFIHSSIHPTIWSSLLSSSGRGQRRRNLMKLGSYRFTDSELEVLPRQSSTIFSFNTRRKLGPEREGHFTRMHVS